MKTRLGIVILLVIGLVAVLGVPAQACDNLAGKATGGGWIIPRGGNGEKVTFGFNAQSDGEKVKGNFELVDHSTGMNVKGDFKGLLFAGTSEDGGLRQDWYGMCSINKGEPVMFKLWIYDNGEPGPMIDKIKVWIDADGDGDPSDGDINYGQQPLDGGNLQVHK